MSCGPKGVVIRARGERKQRLSRVERFIRRLDRDYAPWAGELAAEVVSDGAIQAVNSVLQGRVDSSSLSGAERLEFVELREPWTRQLTLRGHCRDQAELLLPHLTSIRITGLEIARGDVALTCEVLLP